MLGACAAPAIVRYSSLMRIVAPTAKLIIPSTAMVAAINGIDLHNADVGGCLTDVFITLNASTYNAEGREHRGFYYREAIQVIEFQKGIIHAS